MSADAWRGKRIIVTGGAGFLGSRITEQCQSAGADVFVPRSLEYDLTEAGAAQRLYRELQPDLIIHAAGRVGGIGANQENPGKFFYENMAMGLHMIEGARTYGTLEKLVIIGTTCAYPKHTPTPFKESSLWEGYPEETNAPYGIAKRALLVMAQAYRAQYGLQAIYVIPANLYGPRDLFDLETGHVIPALIRKFIEAKLAGKPQVTVWGSGEVSREFLYVDDAARGILLAAQRYNSSQPVNLGSGHEILIRDLVSLIKELTGYQGDICWDRSKPDGQPRRRLDTATAKREFGFEAQTDLQAGLRATIQWYETALLEGRRP